MTKELEDEIAAITDPEFVKYRDELELDRQDYLKRAKFLGTLFDLHEQDHLQLPNVDDYLRPEEVKRIVKEYRPLVRSHRDWESDSDSDYDRFHRQREDGYDNDDDYVYVERIVDAFVYSQPEFSAKGFPCSGKHAARYFKVLEITLDFRGQREELAERREAMEHSERRWRKTTKTGCVVIEEAAEILEAHIVTSLTEDCSQLILIGDHLQLRPSTNFYELEKKYRMNVSLFERMILNNVNLCTLTTQHRMRPEIADLIAGPIYSQLDNHAKVFEYPQVKGVTKNLYFLTHSQLENTDTELLSKSNYFEANFISGLCEYLLQKGYKSHQITILTTYTGQMFLLKKVISEACADVRITCVDNYQGEENDIILLSLARSNEEDKIGFGELTTEFPTWKQIGAKLKAGENCGESLELSCVQHGHKTRVSERSHFAPENLDCGLKCDMVLDCGHSCPLSCHPQDHEKYRCVQKCERKCPFGHPCSFVCWIQCPPCRTPVLNTLACGHNVQVPCCIEALHYLCPVLVTKELQCELKHEKEVPCYKHVSLVKCDILVEKKLEPCGHVRPIQCHQSIDKVDCDAEIDHIFSACNHTRRISCWEKTKRVTCEDKCGKVLDCGHECPEVCHVYDNSIHKNYVCKQTCRRVCALGHPCRFKHPCHGRCPPCPTLIIKTLECGHQVELPCRKNLSMHACTERLPRELTCGHEMLVRCGRKVEDYKCKEGCLREVRMRN
ncbi:NFX1-type zinc finger-containing protein 1 [Orchesella cincta]|uniref:NFX1-type zinc finger-containing protein 1 n=1 Tax=Orchesella cincta TaxID=48709 RepID=A0A1D2MIS8_ORCCI|nr:NFX1-type zinc finger-containing protein 1 [Orchesella cincta]